MSEDTGGSRGRPWWLDTPDVQDVESVMDEAVKLADAVRTWAVDSGMVAVAASMASQAAESLSAALDHTAGNESKRCPDCPVCQGLDLLDETQPEWAATARASLAQMSMLMSGMLENLTAQGSKETDARTAADQGTESGDDQAR